MRKSALLFWGAVIAIVIAWAWIFGGCSEEAGDSSLAPSPEQVPATMSIEELDRAYLRDQGVLSPAYGDGEMGAPSTDAPDAFGLGRELPEHVRLDNFFNNLPADSDNFDAVFLFYYVEIEVEVIELAPRAQQPDIDIWLCEPDIAALPGALRNLSPSPLPTIPVRPWVYPGAPDEDLTVPAIPTLPGTY